MLQNAIGPPRNRKSHFRQKTAKKEAEKKTEEKIYSKRHRPRPNKRGRTVIMHSLQPTPDFSLTTVVCRLSSQIPRKRTAQYRKNYRPEQNPRDLQRAKPTKKTRFKQRRMNPRSGGRASARCALITNFYRIKPVLTLFLRPPTPTAGIRNRPKFRNKGKRSRRPCISVPRGSFHPLPLSYLAIARSLPRNTALFRREKTYALLGPRFAYGCTQDAPTTGNTCYMPFTSEHSGKC